MTFYSVRTTERTEASYASTYSADICNPTLVCRHNVPLQLANVAFGVTIAIVLHETRSELCPRYFGSGSVSPVVSSRSKPSRSSPLPVPFRAQRYPCIWTCSADINNSDLFCQCDIRLELRRSSLFVYIGIVLNKARGQCCSKHLRTPGTSTFVQSMYHQKEGASTLYFRCRDCLYIHVGIDEGALAVQESRRFRQSGLWGPEYRSADTVWNRLLNRQTRRLRLGRFISSCRGIGQCRQRRWPATGR